MQPKVNTDYLLSKLIFPEYAPEITMSDDRLTSISERLRKTLINS